MGMDCGGMGDNVVLTTMALSPEDGVPGISSSEISMSSPEELLPWEQKANSLFLF